MLSEDLVTQLPNGGYLIFPRRVYDQCLTYAQNTNRKPESGGVLIGCARDKHLEITSMTPPDAADKRSRFGFVRRSASHYTRVRSEWKASGHTNTYLGEWHTHPEPHPQPSCIDLWQWQMKLPKRVLILLIIGTQTVWLGLWTRGGKIVTLPELKPDL